MNGPGFSRRPSSNNHLDPGAQEFFPSSVPPPQIFHPYPPPPYDNMMGVYARPAFLSAAADPPPPPLPVSVPPSSLTPSRTLLLSMVPNSVSESTVRRELEVFGDVRAVQMERRREGLVTVHFYDVRDAEAALAAIQEQHMQQQYRIGRHYDAVLMNNGSTHPFIPPPQTARGLITGRVVWAQFTVPVTSGLPDGNNQGTLILFNLDTRVSPPYLRHIFEAFGPVKELRETPNKRHQRFVEFYDVRNAARAMAEMNGRVIYGKAIVIEFSRPGGQVKKFWKGGPFDNGTTNYNRQNLNKRPPLSLSSPENRRRDNERRGNYSGGSEGSKSWSSGSSSLRESIANLCVKSNCLNEDERCSDSSSTRPGDARKKIHCYFKKVNNNNSDGGGGGGGGGGGSSKPQSHGGGCKPWKGGGGGGGGRRGKMEHDPRFLINEEDAIVESDCSIRDSRTTVMIKNIPNKYSQKLLLNMLDNHCIHCNEQLAAAGGGENDQPLSSYDFVYLPIDFINKCNVGYGFVNMTSPEATIRLYKAFHHQNWEVFNSKKICHVTYARLQGLEALREHFKNSKFPAGEAEEYMPVTFSPPRDGVAVPDPVPIVGGRSVTGGGSPSPSSAAASAESSSSEQPLVAEGLNGHSTDNGSSYDGHDEEGGTTGTGVDDENGNRVN
ncbi:hypothetical protein ABFS83_11G062000 [Erythranthe nasuta]